MATALAEVLLIGLLAAVNPCQIAISVAAMAGIAKGRHARGLWLYALGRVVAHTLLAWAILLLLDGSEQAASACSGWFEAVEWLVPWLLMAVALFFLWRALFPCRHHEACHDSGRIIARVGPAGAFLLGMALALCFCPESAVFYFGMMLPLSIAHGQPLLFPLLYAVAAAVPVVLIGWLYERMHTLGERLANILFHVQRLINLLFALLLAAMAAVIWLE